MRCILLCSKVNATYFWTIALFVERRLVLNNGSTWSTVEDGNRIREILRQNDIALKFN